MTRSILITLAIILLVLAWPVEAGAVTMACKTYPQAAEFLRAEPYREEIVGRFIGANTLVFEVWANADTGTVTILRIVPSPSGGCSTIVIGSGTDWHVPPVEPGEGGA